MTQEGTDTLKGKIMLVDDDKFLVEMYSLKFRTAGYTVQAYVNAKDALDALRSGFAPNAVVFDILMPEMEGFSFLEKIHGDKLAQGAVLVALTNQANDFEKKRAEELGCDRYIVKASMIPSEVVQAVEEEIRKKK